MDHQAPDAGWRIAVTATLHCLTGCAIGEVLGIVIGTAAGWHGAATVALAVALAFVFGYAFTVLSTLRAGLALGRAVQVALAADTVSIAIMEIVDNAVVVAVPGAMDAGLTAWLFWGSLAVSLLVAFVVTVPVNHWMIGRGKGHAVVHQFHGGGHAQTHVVADVGAEHAEAAHTGSPHETGADGNSAHTAAAAGDSRHTAAEGDSRHTAAEGDSRYTATEGDSRHHAAEGHSGHIAAEGHPARGDHGHTVEPLERNLHRAG